MPLVTCAGHFEIAIDAGRTEVGAVIPSRAELDRPREVTRVLHDDVVDQMPAIRAERETPTLGGRAVQPVCVRSARRFAGL